MDNYNIGNAMLVIAGLAYKLMGGRYLPYVVIGVGLLSWVYAGFSDERKARYKAETQLLRAKARLADAERKHKWGEK